MLLRDFAKNIKADEIPVSGDIIPAALSLYEIKENDLKDRGESIYLEEPDGSIQKKIETETLLYLIGKMKQFCAQRILDIAEDAVIAVDETGRIFYLNQAYVDILRVKPYKILGRYIQEVEPDSVLAQVVNTHQSVENNMQKIRSLNRYVSVHIKPLFLKDRFVGAVSFFRDVTEVHNLNKKVDSMNNIVNEYSRQLRKLTSLKNMGIVTQDKNFLNILSMAETVAGADVPVLITGENGVGKEVMANYIHQCSARKDKPLITVNCAAIPDDLMESELFGYEEGSFTGAAKGGRKGKFELADGGTIFLDEIGDMPLLMQSKLLRVLQQGEVEKIGRQKKVPVDVRVIAATNQPLQQMIKEKTFRQDLYFRINTISVNIPPLRERKADIPILANQFLEEFNQKYKKNVEFSKEMYEELSEHSWPGNVRELRNYVERSVILSDSRQWKFAEETDAGTQDQPQLPLSEISGRTLAEQMRAFEQQVIINTMKECNYNRSEAMKKLGLSRRTFYRKCEGIDFDGIKQIR